MFFSFTLLLLQCDFNINLMPYSVSPTFLPLMIAQASSACSALIFLLMYAPIEYDTKEIKAVDASKRNRARVRSKANKRQKVAVYGLIFNFIQLFIIQSSLEIIRKQEAMLK